MFAYVSVTLLDIVTPAEFGLDEDASDGEAWDAYFEHREGCLSYWVEEASGPDDIDEDYQ